MAYGFAVYTPYKRNKLSAYPVYDVKKQISEKNETPVIEISEHKKIRDLPYNIFVSLVSREIDHIIENDKTLAKGTCTCNVCRKDMIAISLNKLPSIYITNNINIESKVTSIYNSYKTLLENVVKKSMRKVYSNPSETCDALLKNKIDYLNAA